MNIVSWCLSLLLLSLPQTTPPPAPPPSRDAILAASRTIITGARYATLVTVADAGQPDARIVDPFAPESDFTIWVATNSASRKAAQLARDSRVTLVYFDATSKSYVTVKGTATLVRDDYLLVRITPDTLEVVSVALGMINDPATWRPVTLKLR
jgi:hypothetical protein